LIACAGESRGTRSVLEGSPILTIRLAFCTPGSWRFIPLTESIGPSFAVGVDSKLRNDICPSHDLCANAPVFARAASGFWHNVEI